MATTVDDILKRNTRPGVMEEGQLMQDLTSNIVASGQQKQTSPSGRQLPNTSERSPMDNFTEELVNRVNSGPNAQQAPANGSGNFALTDEDKADLSAQGKSEQDAQKVVDQANNIASYLHGGTNQYNAIGRPTNAMNNNALDKKVLGNVGQTPTTSADTTPAKDVDADSDYKLDPYIERLGKMISQQANGEDENLTPEELKKKKRRERLGKIFDAVGDGVSALSNLYFATKGAPDSYDKDASALKKSQRGENYLRKVYDDNYNRRLTAAERLAELHQKLRRDKIQDEYYKRSLGVREKGNELRGMEVENTRKKLEETARKNSAYIELKQKEQAIKEALADKKIDTMEADILLKKANARYRNVMSNKAEYGETEDTNYEYDFTNPLKPTLTRKTTTKKVGGGKQIANF